MSERPPFAAYIWCDAFNVYVQLPNCDYPLAYTFSEGGLAKALRSLRRSTDINGFAEEFRASLHTPGVKVDRFSSEQKASALALLQKHRSVS